MGVVKTFPKDQLGIYRNVGPGRFVGETGFFVFSQVRLDKVTDCPVGLIYLPRRVQKQEKNNCENTSKPVTPSNLPGTKYLVEMISNRNIIMIKS